MVTAALVCLAAVGCQRAPSVQIEAWVGPQHAKNDDARRAAEAEKVARAAMAEMFPTQTSEADEAAKVIKLAAHPPETPAELEGLIKALREGPLAEIAGPAHRIAAADATLWSELKALMLAERRAPKGDYRSLLAAIGGDVPNRYGHFSLAWKKAHGHRVKLSEDWFADLLSLPRSKVSPVLRKVFRDCVLQTALLRASSRIGQTPALTQDVVGALLTAAYHHQGTFRDEVGRAVQGIGDEAIAVLVRSAVLPDGRIRDEDPAVQRARYAAVQLDRMDRLHPQRAIDAVRADPRRLTEVLAAYGDAKVGEAAAPLLDYVDAMDPTVRATARASMFAYVEGPPPKARRRTIRLLGGETSSARAYLTYRQRAAVALTERLAAEEPQLLEPDCGPPRRGEDTRTPAQIRACAGQPLRHLQAYVQHLDARRTALRTARIDAAIAESSVGERVAALDAVLASEPDLPEADLLAAQYRDAALVALDEQHPAKAAQLLRKSAMLIEPSDTDASRRLRVTALMAEASTPGLSTPGRAMLLATAHGLAPHDARVRSAYDEATRLQAQATPTSKWPWPRIGLGFSGGFFALGLLGLAFGPVRRRLVARPPPDPEAPVG